MPQIINTNIASLNSQRNLNMSQSSLATSLQRLSSGLRINSAKDDAAGLAISERMTSQVRGLNQAVRNANDGISLAQTAEAALGEVGNILQRMRELAIQSANATNSDSDRASLQKEVSQLKAELQRIAENTAFNGQKVLNGAMQNIQFQVGAEANQTIGISIGDARSTTIGSQVVVNNNTANGLQRATNYNRYATEGTNVGKIQALAADINTGGAIANGYSAQTLTIRDAQGNIVQGGEIGVQANQEASTIAERLNELSGVRAEAYTTMRLSSWVSNGTDTITVTLRSGSAEQAFTLSGVDTGDGQEAIFGALKNAINGNADMQNAKVVAGTDAAGNLIIRNSTGADIAIDFAFSGASTAQVDAYGSDTANSSVTLLAAGNGATSVGGQLNLFLANGYTVESNQPGTAGAGGLLDANASAVLTPKETGVGIADVRTQESRSNLVVTTGDDIGKVQTSVTLEANGYAAQTLKIRDASGTVISGGSISIAAGAEAKTVASQLNAISGVSATASSEITLTSFTGTAAGTDAYDAYVTLNDVSGTNDVTLTIAVAAAGETTTTASLVNLEALRDAINSNTTLTENGFAAAFDASGNLKVTNSQGQDIAIGVTDSGGTTSTMTLAGFGADKAGTTFSVSSTSSVDDFVTVGGKLEISLASGYTIESSVNGATAGNGGLLDAGADVAAMAQTTNVAYGNAVAAQTLTINGSASATVDVAKDDSAETIAQKINTVSSTTSVTAEARTQLKLSDISAAATVSFTLYGDNTSGVTISGVVTGAGSLADMSTLAAAINAKSDRTGVSASLTDNNAAIVLTHESGADVVIADFTHSAGTTPNSSNISGTAASLKVAGMYESVDGATGAINTGSATATTLYYGGVGNTGADSTVVGGTISFRSSTTFDVRSSLSGGTSSLVGGNSSLFGTDAGVANTSTLSSVNGVDVSSVAGANAAVSVIDYALTQINNVRGALGAVQNRFESTIASLSAGAENLSAARSRVRDADFAQETANLTRSQILQQAGVAMLSQANQLPQLVLSLLK